MSPTTFQTLTRQTKPYCSQSNDPQSKAPNPWNSGPESRSIPFHFSSRGTGFVPFFSYQLILFTKTSDNKINTTQILDVQWLTVLYSTEDKSVQEIRHILMSSSILEPNIMHHYHLNLTYPSLSLTIPNPPWLVTGWSMDRMKSLKITTRMINIGMFATGWRI